MGVALPPGTGVGALAGIVHGVLVGGILLGTPGREETPLGSGDA